MVKPSLLFLGVLLCIARKRKYPDFQELHSEVFRGEMVWCLKLKRRADRAKYCLWGSILAGNTWSSSFFKRTALQSCPTEPRDPHSRAFGPAPPNSGLGTWVLQPLSHLMAGASALCAGTGFPFRRCSWEHTGSQWECCSTPWTPYFLQAVRQKGRPELWLNPARFS